MPYTPKMMYSGQPGTTATTLYTVPASTTAIVKKINICNTTASDATITINFVASGNAVSAANRVTSSLTITANSTVPIDQMSDVIATGGFISATQGTASAITLYISGIEVT